MGDWVGFMLHDTIPASEAALDAALRVVGQRLQLVGRHAVLRQLVQRLLEVGHRQHGPQEEHLEQEHMPKWSGPPAHKVLVQHGLGVNPLASACCLLMLCECTKTGRRNCCVNTLTLNLLASKAGKSCWLAEGWLRE